jgi:hypothetical protein
MSERAPDLAYSEEVGKVYKQADYYEAVRILVPVSRNDITPTTHRVVVPKMYREIARAIGRARIAERERCSLIAVAAANDTDAMKGRNSPDTWERACACVAERIVG